MALSERLAILITANGSQAMSEFQKTGKAAERSLATTEQRVQRFGASLTRIGAGALVFGGVLATGMYQAAKAAGEQEAANLRLENTLANQPSLATASAQAFYDQASALQEVTTFGDEVTVSAQAMLGQFGLTQDQILELIPLVQDYAAKTGTDLVTAARNVGKATDGTNTTLRRAGVEFDDAAFAADHFGATVQALQRYAGGFAEQEGQTLAGQIEILKNRFGELAEGVGGGAADAFGDLAGVVGALADGLEKLPAPAQNFIGKTLTFGAIGLSAAGALGMLVGQVIKLAPAFQAVTAIGPRAYAAIANLIVPTNTLTTAFHGLTAAQTASTAASPVGWIAATAAAIPPAVAGMAALADKVSEITNLFRVQASINPFGEDGMFGDGVQVIQGGVATAVGKLNELNQAMYGTDVAAGAAEQALDEFSATLDEYLTGLFSVPDAQRDLQASFGALQEAMTSSEPNWLTQAQSMEDIVTGTAKVIEAQVQQGASQQQLDATIANSITMLTAMRNSGAITQEQFRTLTEQIEGIPPARQTAYTTPGLPGAHMRTFVYRGLVVSVPPNWKTTFEAATGTAIANVQALIDRIHVLNNTVVRPQGSGIAGQVGAISANIFHKAEGGRFSAGDLMEVGERGRELVMFGSPGTVIPNGPTEALMSGRGGSTITVNVHGTATAADGQAVVDALRRWQQRNGPVPVKVSA